MFHDCTSEAEVKKLYRKLALLVHPDRGGDTEIMAKLTRAYDRALGEIPRPRSNASPSQSRSAPRPKPAPEPKPQPEAPRPRKEGESYTESSETIVRGDWRLGIIAELLAFHQVKPIFKKDFIQSVSMFSQVRGFITHGQYNALVRMYNIFGLNKS